MTVMVQITDSGGGVRSMATTGKAFKGRKRNALQALRSILTRVIQNDLRESQRAAETGDNSRLVFRTQGSLNQANAVLQRVADALDR